MESELVVQGSRLIRPYYETSTISLSFSLGVSVLLKRMIYKYPMCHIHNLYSAAYKKHLLKTFK